MMKRKLTFLLAVFALTAFLIAPLGMMGQTRETVKDVMTASNLAATGTSYTEFTGVSLTSNAVYAGKSALNNNVNIQLRSQNSDCGIVSTTSGGKIRSVKITVASGNKTIDVYGSNTAYTSAANLFATSGNNNQGTKLGSLTSTGTITVSGDYAYVGIRSNSGAVYISSIEFTWESVSADTPTHAYTLNVTGDDDDAEVALYVNGNELGANDEIAEGESVTVSVIPSDGYTYSVSVVDANNATVEYDDEMDSFTMPTSAVTITVTTALIPTYAVTFNTNGGTFVGNQDFPQLSNEKQAGTYVLPSATKTGFAFGGWLATGSVNVVTGSYEVTGNVDFTAQWIQGVTDVLNREFTGISNNGNYAEWSGKIGASGAVYAGQSAGGNDAIQLRTNNSNSGIVTTTSGGKVKKVTVVWEGNTQSGRTLNVYGRNTAYSKATDLYNENTAGDLLGTIVYGTSTELVITGDYAFIGLRSAENAMYLTEIDITWGSAAAVAAPTFEPGSGTTFHDTQMVTISAEEGAAIRYTTDGTEPTATTGTLYEGPFSIDASKTVKAVAYATIEGETETSAVAEAVYTRLYNITLTQPFHGSISCVAEAAAGTTVAVTANSEVNYQFSSLTVTPTATVNGTSFIMPAADVNVTATFMPANTYTISFSINNKVEMTATTTGSIDVDNFIANVTTEGKRFKGWYDGDNRVSSNYNPGTNKTLVAVFEDTSSAYNLVTSTDQLLEGNMVVITANGEKNIAMGAQRDNNRDISENVEKSAAPYDLLSITGDGVCELVLGKVVEGSTTYWTFKDNVEGGYLYTASTSSNYLKTQATNDDNGEWAISISNGSANIVSHGGSTHNILKYNTSNKVFSSYASNSGNTQTVFLYTKSASKAMRDGEVEATSVVAEVAANVVVTVKNEGIVYLTGVNNGTAANLVVEDGGQLVTPANVAGTMQKDVTGYGNTTVASNYYLITAPSTIDPQNVEYMLNTNGYDLYYFDQSAEDEVEGENVLLEWRNYKDVPFSLEAGTGYLYANKENKTLNLAGTLAKNDNNETFAQNITYVDGFRFSGWNLVGNPFSSNASVSLPFYKMNSDGDGINATVMLANSVIAPMEGVFVIASAATTQVTFTATTDAISSGAKNSVKIDVNRDNELLDRAIVSFNGCTLSKLNLSENATKVYFQQGQEEFAIVSVENEGELPVNFKASRNSRYTISVNAEDLDVTYLHLIDNKTGNDVDLLVNPNYSFEANTNDYASRFKLVFKAGTGVEENASTSSATFAYFNGAEWIVNNEGNATLQVIDMMGRVISSEQINGNTAVNINEAAGIYMLRLVNGENVMVQKIVVR